jgi:pilus assembly protein CpaF
VRLETRPANIEGKGEVGQRELVKNCLRMRPDRVVIGECRGAEALDMLQAMNTGHEGSMTTIHANTPRDAMSRLEVMIAMAGYDIPTRALRSQVSSAIQVVVQARRLPGGRRKVTQVSEITGMEGEQITMHDLFFFEQSGVDGDGHATGRFVCNGIRPKCAERIEHRGIRLPADLFQRRVFEG